ncbi:hypothetical protein H5410_047889 [Solanum commersonii]|uniref:Uncharacterized protein n=1 Tax=Solanum commersonii TaxID=4109 RepID=A0A9J5XIP3_SOLCO|nr:hypothetical protein H5410_047889 [Solanum commersonii]
MGIPFLLALSISSRRANSLLHFLKCVLSRPVPPCVPVVTCFMINLHFVQNYFLLPIIFLSDIGLLPLYFSKFMFKSKIINIMKDKQR